jgi:hypothetical protein
MIPEARAGMHSQLIKMSTEDVLKFHAYQRVIHNKLTCSPCEYPMGLVAVKDRTDGFMWRCPKCKHVKSVRDDSFFALSKLPIHELLIVIYIWSTNWGNNTY